MTTNDPDGPEQAPLRPFDLPALSGEERFDGVDATVLDFWRWALGDLRMNNSRGHLVEFLVAKAVSSADPVRVEWGPQDVVAANGTRIEVKSSAYLQSWAQKKPSTPSFSITSATQIWDETRGIYRDDPRGRVDVWVFALHTCTDHALYQPLDVGQWEFWVLPDHAVTDLGQKTAGLSTIKRVANTGGIALSELATAVSRAGDIQTAHNRNKAV